MRQYAVIAFNKFDSNAGVDRRSYTGAYKVINGIPRNPVSRTGIHGRGSLGRWGPNHMAEALITRWRRDDDNAIVLKNTLPILEFVSVGLPSCELSLPKGFISPEEMLPEIMRELFGKHIQGDFQDDSAPKWDSPTTVRLLALLAHKL